MVVALEIMEEKYQWLPCEGELAREARLRGCKLAVSEVLIPSVRPAACHLPLGTKGRLIPTKD